jgi:hypothetical protein
MDLVIDQRRLREFLGIITNNNGKTKTIRYYRELLHFGWEEFILGETFHLLAFWVYDNKHKGKTYNVRNLFNSAYNDMSAFLGGTVPLIPLV